MKKFILTALAMFVVVFSSALGASAQTKKVEETTGLLYKISGKDLKKPSYLFGTIHIVCPNDMFSMEKLSGYLDQTDQLVMELDMDNPAEIQAMTAGMVMRDGKTLKDFLTAEEYTKVDETFKNYMGVSVDAVKQVKPFALAMIISTNPKALGCTPNSYEASLLKSATDRKKGVEGLETASSQFAVFEKMPLEKQAQDLYKLALDPQKSFDGFKKLTETYKSQNSENLYALMDSQMSENKALQTSLLDDRNIDWIPKIERAIAGKSSFIAVGGGHLGGAKGVVALLRAKGYKIEAIKL